jgi:hypothetical protein
MSLTEVSLAIFSLAEVKAVQPMPDSNSLILYSIASLASFSLPAAKTFQPMPQQQNSLDAAKRFSQCPVPKFLYTITYLLIGCSQDISNNACQTN